MTTLELVRLNEHLNDPNHTVGLFDQLPLGHPGGAHLVDMATAEFLDAGWHEAVVRAGNPEAAFDRERFALSAAADRHQGDEMLQAVVRRRVIEKGARGVEALAGAGQVERAIALARYHY
jgi:hypothetical protein